MSGSTGQGGGLTGSEVLAAGLRVLRDAGIPEAAGDARRLLAFALGLEAGRLTLVLPDPVEPGSAEAFKALIARRANREPVTHLVGVRSFWGRDFLVTKEVLDPRPETEMLVAVALEDPFARLLDLGTGSGCLLVTLLAERPHSSGVGTDVSHAALQVAGRNAARHGVADRATFLRSDWFGNVQGRFDLIVSNPPYIAASEMTTLEPEVRDWEPRLALTDEADGLDAYRVIVAEALPHLSPGGRLLLEHGPTQADAIADLGQAHGFPPPEHRQDFDGRRRACLFRVP